MVCVCVRVREWMGGVCGWVGVWVRLRVLMGKQWGVEKWN